MDMCWMIHNHSIHEENVKCIKEDLQMATSTEYLDAVFNGTGTVINTAQNVCDAIAAGVNDVRNIRDNSRRNQPPMMCNNYGGYNDGQNQPVTYPYGYSDNGYNNYYGYPNSNGMGMRSPNNDPDYYAGFTDPGYGNMGATVPNGSFGNSRGPKGGAWL